MKLINLKDLNSLTWDNKQFFSGFGSAGLDSCSFRFYSFEKSTNTDGNISYYFCLSSSKQKFLESSFRRGGGCADFHISMMDEKYFISFSKEEWERLTLKDAASLLRRNRNND